MANTYSQLYIQVVFGVRHRQALLDPKWDVQVHRYITGILHELGHKSLAINGTKDHIHIFFGMKPDCNLSEFVREMKKATTRYINDNQLTRGKFQWQTGFGAFSYSKDAVNDVCKYVIKQKEHHKQEAFSREYRQMLEDFGVEYKDEYLFVDVN